MARAFLFGIIFCMFLLCDPKTKEPSRTILPAQKIERKLSIASVGVVEFNRSFSFLQSSTIRQKEIKRLYDETMESNPLFIHPYYKADTTDRILKKHFERLGLVKGDEFLLPGFKYSSKPDTSIVNSLAENIDIRVYRDTVAWGDHDKVIISNGKDADSAKATIYLKIKYALLDVIPGGNKELVLLNEHYLMNTEFYYFEVFEIKTQE